MNILQQEDIIKGLPDQALQEEAKKPSGQVPQFLVVSEIQRRTDMRKKYQDPNQQQPQGTVADQITQEGIASVQPQQPQGQQQQGQPMPMRGGGMTPFMRKYASGGVVRMQDGGMTPHDMAQMDAQMMSQKYPFLSGSKDQVLQGLSSVDPSDFSYISSMFNNSPEIDAVLNSLQPTPDPVSFDQSMLDTMDNRMPLPPMVENITPQSTLMLDGVMTTTPDGQRPYAPNTPSIDSLDQFANAFREDAARAENLLATLDDSTAKEKEAISNPVNVNLPKIRTLEEIGRDAPQMLPLAARVEPEINPRRFGPFLDRFIENYEKGTSDLGSGPMGSRDGSKTSGANRGLFQKAEGSDKTFYFGGSDSKSSDATSSEPVGTGTVLRQPVGTNTVLRKDNGMYLPHLANPDLFSNLEREVTPEVTLNETVISDGATSGESGDGATFEGSGDKLAKGANNSAGIMNRILNLNLDGAQKEAYAMAMIQLGAGIAKGDLAEGLSNAGVAASGVLEKSRDRAGKQLDREIQSKYYDAKLRDSRLDRESKIREKAGTLALKKYTAEATSPLNLAKFSKMSQAEKDKRYNDIFQEELRVLTQSATGSDMRRGGNLAESLNEDPLGLRKT